MSGEPVSIKLLAAPFDPGRALSEFTAAHPDAGGIASFLGVTRQSGANEPVQHLILQCYPGVTERAIEDLCRTAHDQWPLLGVSVIHRYGTMAPGDPIVFVAAASIHRQEALAATEFLIDNLKTRAPFWKKEVTASGSRWIEPTLEDYAKTADLHPAPQGFKNARR